MGKQFWKPRSVVPFPNAMDVAEPKNSLQPLKVRSLSLSNLRKPRPSALLVKWSGQWNSTPGGTTFLDIGEGSAGNTGRSAAICSHFFNGSSLDKVGRINSAVYSGPAMYIRPPPHSW